MAALAATGDRIVPSPWTMGCRSPVMAKKLPCAKLFGLEHEVFGVPFSDDEAGSSAGRRLSPRQHTRSLRRTCADGESEAAASMTFLKEMLGTRSWCEAARAERGVTCAFNVALASWSWNAVPASVRGGAFGGKRKSATGASRVGRRGKPTCAEQSTRSTAPSHCRLPKM